MPVSAINRYLLAFERAFHDVGARVPIEATERIAILVHHAMHHERRVYHASWHVFDVMEGMNARQTLGVLFHDVVYSQVDRGLPVKSRDILMPLVELDADGGTLRSWLEDDTALNLCGGVFGCRGGDRLPLTNGLNEFLSAVLAARLLGPYLTLTDLLAVVACIEATIPFRAPGTDGRPVFDRLEDRVRQTADRVGLHLPDGEVHRIVADAVGVANRDVANFASEDPGRFLATTWLLIEEGNAPLEAVGAFSVGEYLRALIGMERFTHMLNLDRIFHAFRGQPSDGDLARLTDAARTNLAFARAYLSGKIVTMAVLEALARETGGDCPVSLLLGDIDDQSIVGWMGEPPPIGPVPDDVQPTLVAMFERGRPGKPTFDLLTSPLTAQIYRREGHAGLLRAADAAKSMFVGELTPAAFLGGLRPELVRWMAQASARVAPSRAVKLRAVADRFLTRD